MKKLFGGSKFMKRNTTIKRIVARILFFGTLILIGYGALNLMNATLMPLELDAAIRHNNAEWIQEVELAMSKSAISSMPESIQLALLALSIITTFAVVMVLIFSIAEIGRRSKMRHSKARR